MGAKCLVPETRGQIVDDRRYRKLDAALDFQLITVERRAETGMRIDILDRGRGEILFEWRTGGLRADATLFHKEGDAEQRVRIATRLYVPIFQIGDQRWLGKN